MNIPRVHFSRERLVADEKGMLAGTIEFSCDDRFVRMPRFFGVPEVEQAQARLLYPEWGCRP